MSWYAITFIVVISVVMYILFGVATAYLLHHYGHHTKQEAILAGFVWWAVWMAVLCEQFITNVLFRGVEKLASWWEKKESK